MGSSLCEALLPSQAFRRQNPGVMGFWQLRSHDAGVEGVLEDPDDTAVPNRAPLECRGPLPVRGPRKVHALGRELQQDLTCAADLAETSKDHPHRLLHAHIGIKAKPSLSVPCVAKRDADAQLAPPRLR